VRASHPSYPVTTATATYDVFRHVPRGKQPETIAFTIQDDEREAMAELRRRIDVRYSSVPVPESAPDCPTEPEPEPVAEALPLSAPTAEDPLAAEWTDYARWRESGELAEAIAVQYGEACRLPYREPTPQRAPLRMRLRVRHVPAPADLAEANCLRCLNARTLPDGQPCPACVTQAWAA
jgi:hypothetical protein